MNDLNIRVQSASFGKNNEYFNDYTEGFTAIGFFLRPTLEYYFNSSTKANLGIHLLKYSGMNRFLQVLPVFSVQHEFNENFEIVLGNIYGTLNHNLEEPLFRYDQYYKQNVEYGIQLLYNSEYATSDIWINWRKFIQRGDPHREKFTIGNTSIVHLLKKEKVAINLPIQLLLNHEGGQINKSQLPTYTIFNGVSGIQLQYGNSDENYIELEPLVFWHTGPEYDAEIGNISAYKSGKALYLKLNYQFHQLYGMLGYWNSDRFIAPGGEYLFMSISEVNNSLRVQKRELLTAKIGLEKNISKSMNFQLRADGYYDLQNNDIAYSVGLYFIIDRSFFITEIK